ncbi:hypothetical protein Tco_0273743 [Tanacetum coccineum]
MSFSKRSDNAFVCYTKPIDSLKNWNDHFFWVDDFACPASFPWHTAKHVIRDPAPVAADFNEKDYATLVAHPSLEEMDIFAFIHTPDPTKVKKFKRERNEGEPLLLETTIGRTISLLPVAPDHTIVEDVAPVQPKRQGKRKSVIVGAGEASHPPKKLREDHGTPSGTSVGGKSRSAIKSLLVGAALNAEVGVAAIPTLPFVTASVSTTPEREGGDHTDFVAGLNLPCRG